MSGNAHIIVMVLASLFAGVAILLLLRSVWQHRTPIKSRSTDNRSRWERTPEIASSRRLTTAMMILLLFKEPGIMNVKPLAAFALAGLSFLSGCTITPPEVSVSANDPSNPEAAEAASAPLRPRLMAGARTYLSPRTGADAQQMQHGGGPDMAGMDHATPGGKAEITSGYTCPMHPEVQSDKPGNCPKCGMTLVPRESPDKGEAPEEKTP